MASVLGGEMRVGFLHTSMYSLEAGQALKLGLFETRTGYLYVYMSWLVWVVSECWGCRRCTCIRDSASSLCLFLSRLNM